MSRFFWARATSVIRPTGPSRTGRAGKEN